MYEKDGATYSPLSLLEAQKKRKIHNGYTGCIVLTHNDCILLQLRDNKFKTAANCIATFGGRIEQDESPEQTLCQELQEELGAKVLSSDLIFISTYTEAISHFSDVIYGYFWHEAVLFDKKSRASHFSCMGLCIQKRGWSWIKTKWYVKIEDGLTREGVLI